MKPLLTDDELLKNKYEDLLENYAALQTDLAQQTEKTLAALQELNESKFEILKISRTLSWQLTQPIRMACELIERCLKLKTPLLSPAAIQSTMVLYVRQSLQNYTFQLSFPRHDTPLVSVIIPVHNKIEFTLRCLQSIQDHPSRNTFEIIIIDDASTDTSFESLSKIEGLRTFKNPHNAGFLHSCNRGAQEARGRYLLFVNNDTLVLPGWLDELVKTFAAFPEAGLVGSKLLYPDGKLQEAGCILWQDASAWNFGCGQDAKDPLYNYLREVDYCSGACMLVDKQLFDSLRGFDPLFAPAYYEDTDLALKIRQAGRKVFYQPFSQVVHFEGVSCGQDVRTGIKQYQETNRIKFLQKWRAVLSKYNMNGISPETEKERLVQKRMLILDSCVPTPDQDSGSLDLYHYIRIFQSLGFKITFIAGNMAYDRDYTARLQRSGVECLYHPFTPSLRSHLKKKGGLYDIVFICRLEMMTRYFSTVKNYCPQARVYYQTVDLHHIREKRRALLENNPHLHKLADELKTKELFFAAQADCTLVVSPVERKILLEHDPRLNIAWVPTPRDVHGRARPFEKRQNILFLGGFQHLPNVDAMLYFTKEIWPGVQSLLPGVRLIIAGSNPPQKIWDLASENIGITGYVKDLAEYFDGCRLSIAPLRYGAGTKGKIITSLSYGVPVVATPIAGEGMSLTKDEDILIADNPSEFAKAIHRLYTNPQLWQRLSDSGLEAMKRLYSVDHVKKNLEDLLNTTPAKNLEVLVSQPV